MGNATHSVLTELAPFFSVWTHLCTTSEGLTQAWGAGDRTSYAPATDMRIVRRWSESRADAQSERARFQRIVDELSAADLTVLRLACADRSPGYPCVGAELPAAKEQGRRLAERELVSAHLEAELRLLRRLGFSGIAAAQRVLEEERRYRPHVTAWHVDRATWLGVKAGEIDVSEAATARVDAAARAYVSAKAAFGDMKRSARDREVRRREEFAASLRSSKEQRKRERLNKRVTLDVIKAGVDLMNRRTG